MGKRLIAVVISSIEMVSLLTGCGNKNEQGKIRIKGIGDVTITQERNAKMDYAIANRSWLIGMWHGVTDEDNGHYQWISTKEADAHLAYIACQRNEGNYG